MKIQAIKDLYRPCTTLEPPFLAQGETATIIKNVTSGSLTKIKPDDFCHIRRDSDGEVLRTFGSRFMSSVIERPIKDEGLEDLALFFDRFTELIKESNLDVNKMTKVRDKEF